jgi:hypothetical protein
MHHRLFDLLAVDPGAVGAPQVANQYPVAIEGQAAVSP